MICYNSRNLPEAIEYQERYQAKLAAARNFVVAARELTRLLDTDSPIFSLITQILDRPELVESDDVLM
jgi:hypothetical protein